MFAREEWQQVMEYVKQNKRIWSEIHECIRSNNLEKLMTLFSQHTINLNSFNSFDLSRDGDTILHSAAKSNNVKMMEFILQRISLSTKERMINMRNYQWQLPADLVRIWTPSIHSLFPLKFRQVVKAVLMLGAKRQDGTPYYPQTHFYKLPKDVLFLILNYAAFPTTEQPKETEKQQAYRQQEKKVKLSSVPKKTQRVCFGTCCLKLTCTISTNMFILG